MHVSSIAAIAFIVPTYGGREGGGGKAQSFPAKLWEASLVFYLVFRKHLNLMLLYASQEN